MSADWKIEFTPTGARSFRKLDRSVQKRLQVQINHLAALKDPRAFGKALKGNLSGLWRWRVDDYRIIGSIEDKKLTIYVLYTGHRKSVYKRL